MVLLGVIDPEPCDVPMIRSALVCLTLACLGACATQAKPPTAPPQPPEPASRAETDVAPEKVITEMVDKERAEKSGKKDLLDASRPEE